MHQLELEYQAALDYLYSFVDYSLTRNLHYSPEKFELGRMRQFLQLLGNPQAQYPVIHVAGTKGKGSTAVMIASVLQASGLKVGCYTSPHLQEYTERIQVDRCEIPRADLVDLLGEMKPWVAQVEKLTTFEITTALGFLYFARQKVDVAVMEVGLGGRLDATNVVEPLVSVITSLSMDHMNVLGDTLAKIAFEKAGIIKPGRPVISAPQREEARLVLERTAAERGCQMVQVGKDVMFSGVAHDLYGQSLHVWKADHQPEMDRFIEEPAAANWKPLTLKIPLLGYHQVQNAATAYAALQTAREMGLPVNEDCVVQGFARVVWPGRFEILQRSPLLVIDSAHNRDSALKLRLTLEDYLPGRPVILLFGASEDKDVQGMFEELMPRVSRVIATQSVHPRALAAEQIVAAAHRLGRPAQAVLPVEQALQTALALAEKQNAVVLAAGSLFIAAAVRDAWKSIQAIALGEK